MADDQVDITFSHPHDGHKVGDRAPVDRLEAKRLVRAGVATYSTQAAAKAAEGEAGTEKTTAAVKKSASGA